MSEWDFDCPKYVDLPRVSDDESDGSPESYFENRKEDGIFRRITRSVTAALGILKPQTDASAVSTPADCPYSKATTSPFKENCHPEGKPTHKQTVELQGKRRPLRVHNGDDSHCRTTLNKPAVTLATKMPATVLSVKKRASASTTKSPCAASTAKKPLTASTAKKPPTASTAKKPPTASTAKKLPTASTARKLPTASTARRLPTALAVKKPAAASRAKPATPLTAKKPSAASRIRKPGPAPAAMCQSLAEFVGNFQKKTPARFRKVFNAEGGQCRNMEPRKPTIPVTPNLATRLRSQAVRARDQEERVNAYSSKPKRPEVKPSVAPWPKSGPASSIVKPECTSLVSKPLLDSLSTKSVQISCEKLKKVRRTTVAKSPAFALKARSETWKQRKDKNASSIEELKKVRRTTIAKPPAFALKARSEARKQREDKNVSSIEEVKKVRRTTIAKSPAFALKVRREAWKQRKENAFGLDSRKVACQGTEAPRKILGRQKRTHQHREAAAVQQAVHRRTAVLRRQSLSQQFLDRQKRTLQRKETTVGAAAEIKQVEPPKFRAQPAPDPKRVFRPQNSSLPPTKPRPFRLASVERHEKCQEEFRRKTKELETERAQMVKFVAKPVPAFVKARRKSVNEAKPGTSGHASRPRHR